MSPISAALRVMGSMVSPAGPSGCLTVLTYHRVLHEPDPMEDLDQIDARCLSGQLAAVKEHFKVLPLPEALALLDAGKLPARALSITFDDGYLDNHAVAFPVLQKLGLHATFFVATDYLGNGIMFNDIMIEAARQASGPELDLTWLGLNTRPTGSIAERRHLAIELTNLVKYMPYEQRKATCQRVWEQVAGHAPYPSLMMTADHVADLSRAGMTIGGHTHTHPILTRVPLDLAREDIRQNFECLKGITGQSPTLFAYPNGRPGTDYGVAQRNLVAESGYQAAVTTARGVVTREVDRFQLPRFSPWGLEPTRLIVHLIRNALRGRHPDVV